MQFGIFRFVKTLIEKLNTGISQIPAKLNVTVKLTEYDGDFGVLQTSENHTEYWKQNRVANKLVFSCVTANR